MADNIKKNMRITGTLQDVLTDCLHLSGDEFVEVVLDSGVTVQDVFNFEDNQASVLQEYSPSEKASNNNQASMSLVKAGTWLRIPVPMLDEAAKFGYKRVQDATANIQVGEPLTVLNDYAQGVLKAYSGMVKSKRMRHGMMNTNETIETDPVIRVFVLSRTYNGASGKDRLINISPYVISSVVSVGSGGGKFNLSLDPMTAKGGNDGWGVPVDISEVSTREGAYGGEYLSDSHTHRDTTVLKKLNVPSSGVDSKDKELADWANGGSAAVNSEPYSVRNEHAFSMLISSQDMVFIKFDPMDSEASKGYRSIDLLNPFEEARLSDFRGDYWDMIGLVDGVDENGSIAEANMRIDISGRDLMKLMIEDGVYFFPITSADGYQSNYFANAQDTRTYRRMLGEIQELALFTNKPVTDLLKFIYGKLSTVEIWPDTVFNGIDKAYPDGVGVWKMTQLVVDEEVGKRQLFDQGLRTQTGTMLSFIQSVCQSPFIEFFGDTYGDRYAFIARRPPYTHDDILKVFTAGGEVTITESEIDSISLDMADDEAFSWYRLTPSGFMFGGSDMAMFYFPAIYLEEYAKIFGSRKMEFESRFLDYDGAKNSDAVYTQSLGDLQYVIQATAYLPFSRKGTIKVRTNRRIKRGTWIYVEGTDELCYVEDVSHAYSINKDTVSADTMITVSRCMKRRHLRKYFALVNFPGQVGTQAKERRVSWSVNNAVFDWFVAKKQFVS